MPLRQALLQQQAVLQRRLKAQHRLHQMQTQLLVKRLTQLPALQRLPLQLLKQVMRVLQVHMQQLPRVLPML